MKNLNEILERIDSLRDLDYCRGYGNCDCQCCRIEDLILPVCKEYALSCVPDEKTNEDYNRELNTPDSKWGHGHGLGWNLCREQNIKNIKG